MPNKHNIKSRRVESRIRRNKTRKLGSRTTYLDRKERIRQAAIAGAIIQEQVAALRGAGAGAGAGAIDDVLNFEEAVHILHNAADQAANPAPLHAQIDLQAADILRSGCVIRYSVKQLINVFMTLALVYYAQFPIHAAPKETSLFDVAASHLSLAGTVMDMASLPYSGTLAYCAYGAKGIGKLVRNYNAASGRYANGPGDAARRRLNLAEYDPITGGLLSHARLAGIGAGAAMNALTGASTGFKKIASEAAGSTLANVTVNIGKRVGKSEEAALETAAAKFAR
jgi:hypothetical protein